MHQNRRFALAFQKEPYPGVFLFQAQNLPVQQLALVGVVRVDDSAASVSLPKQRQDSRVWHLGIFLAPSPEDESDEQFVRLRGGGKYLSCLQVHWCKRALILF